MRVRGPRDYIRLSQHWYQDAVLCACADIEPAALWVWPVLIGMGKAEMHDTENPEGIFRASIKGLAAAIRVPEQRVSDALALLADGELIAYETTTLGLLKIRVCRLSKWQVAPFSVAERKQTQRDRDAGLFAGTNASSVTVSHGSVTKTRRDETREEKTNNLGRSNDPCIPDSSNQVVRQQSMSQTETVRNRTIQKPTDEQVEQAIAAHRERLGERNAALVDELVAVLAEKNKSGRVAASKTLRTLWQPLGDASERFSVEALEYGLRAAIAKPAPNPNYVKRAAEGYSPSSNVVPISSGPQRQRLSSITDEQLDGWI